jgi:tetratricopeptide (TPR) repeat protein
LSPSALRRGAGKEPGSAAALTGLGEIQRRNGEYNNARSTFGKALEYDAQYWPALLAMSKVGRAQGDNQISLDFLNKALAVSPENVEVLTEMAMLYDNLGQEAQAEPLYAKVATLRPDLPSAHNNLGFNYLLQGVTPTPSRHFPCHGPQAGNSRTHNNLGGLRLNGNEEKALQIFEKAVGKAAAYNNLGYIYMTQGEWDKAEKSFKHALDLNPRFYVRAQENLDRLNRMRSKPGK